MEYLKSYFLTYFPLICISVGMLFVAIYNYKIKKKTARYIIAIVLSALLLSVLLTLEHYFADNSLLIPTTLCAFLGYSIRPIVLFLFIRLGEDEDKKWQAFMLIPLACNVLIYSFSLFVGTPLERIVFYYASDVSGGPLIHHKGTILNFSSHFISAVYLIYIIYISAKKLKTKHIPDAFAIFTCALFTVVAVVIESITGVQGLLNNTIGVSVVFYYLFMFNQISRKDPLTGLFERKSFYGDLSRYSKELNAIIQFDMNGLKLLNDKLGHEEGDKALIVLGKTIEKHLGHSMYGYRLGGDEFVVLSFGASEEKIKKYISLVKEDLANTKYSCAVGCALKDEINDDFEKMMKASEINMYEEKKKYYVDNHIERRKK